jgi:hypothetical protein
MDGLLEVSRMTVKMSGVGLCANIDCLGRALAADAAWRQIDAAQKDLIDSLKLQASIPHTDAAQVAIKSLNLAKDFLRDYSVSPELTKPATL